MDFPILPFESYAQDVTLRLTERMLASTLVAALPAAPRANLGTPRPCFPRRDVLCAAVGASVGPLPTLAAPRYASAVTLADGLVFPLASFGLQQYDDATAEERTMAALDAGYRNFFASVLAGNQRGFARAVKASGVPRSELFICGSVVSNRALDADTAFKLTQLGCRENMEAFAAGGIDTLDMIMLDYPCQDSDCIRAQWRAFEEFKAAGGAKSLAVSNFVPAQLDAILLDPAMRAKPTVNQLPYCVGYHDPGVVAANRRRGIHVQAWSPLGNGRLTRFSRDREAMARACAEVGAPYGKSAYQVALRFITQSGASFAVEAKTAAHFREDIDIFDFELSQADMSRLESYNAQPAWEGSITEPS